VEIEALAHLSAAMEAQRWLNMFTDDPELLGKEKMAEEEVIGGSSAGLAL
jgi:hypothetical protein